VLGVLGNGDTFVVTRLDRLGRSLRDLANVAHEIEEGGANLKVLEVPRPSRSAYGARDPGVGVLQYRRD
jgi:DNA invertase Pin-like site-specific DNA recombinase